MTVKDFLKKNRKSYLRYVVTRNNDEEHLFTEKEVIKKFGDCEIVSVASARNLYIDI